MLEQWQQFRFRRYIANLAKRSTIIVSAGMPRSGSTWLYNAARLLLNRNAPLACGWWGDWRKLPRSETMLFKVHDFEPFLARRANIVLYSFRDVRDALASNRRKFGTEPSVELAGMWLEHDRRWRSVANYVLRYESMLEDPNRCLQRLADILNIESFDEQEVLGQLAQLPKRGSGENHTYDATSLLHPGHVTDGRHGAWRDWIAADELQQIHDRCGQWLTRNGYEF